MALGFLRFFKNLVLSNIEIFGFLGFSAITFNIKFSLDLQKVRQKHAPKNLLKVVLKLVNITVFHEETEAF